MKNLNPVSGYKQSITGHFYICRIDVIDLRRKYGLTMGEIGYFISLVSCADWDKSENRFGYLRLDINELSNILNIPKKTIRENLARLFQKKVIFKSNGVYKIHEFQRFLYSSAANHSKEVFTDAEVIDYFNIKNKLGKSTLLAEKTEEGGEKSHSSLIEKSNSFRYPFKNEYKNINTNIDYSIGTNVQRNVLSEDSNELSDEDKLWIDKNL